MKLTLRLTAAMCGAFTLCAVAKDIEDATPTPAPLLSTDISGSDLSFLTSAAHDIALLAKISELASKHATIPEVQAEAATVLKEQTDAMAALQKLAAGYHVSLDTELYGDDQRLVKSLDADKGLKFDKAYLDAQADADQALQASLTTGAASSDAGIKAFAHEALTRLKAEQDRVRRLGF
jgi:predicted outer membrane protein